MRTLLLALLLVSLSSADALARHRGCHSRAPQVRYNYGYRAPRIRYYRSSPRTSYFSIYHTSQQRRSFPQPTAPLDYRGVYPQIVHSAGIEYLKPELGPREVAVP